MYRTGPLPFLFHAKNIYKRNIASNTGKGFLKLLNEAVYTSKSRNTPLQDL